MVADSRTWRRVLFHQFLAATLSAKSQGDKHEGRGHLPRFCAFVSLFSFFLGTAASSIESSSGCNILRFRSQVVPRSLLQHCEVVLCASWTPMLFPSLVRNEKTSFLTRQKLGVTLKAGRAKLASRAKFKASSPSAGANICTSPRLRGGLAFCFSFEPVGIFCKHLCSSFIRVPGCRSTAATLHSGPSAVCRSLPPSFRLAKKMPSLVSGRHRTPAELQAALKVVNDQLADANDVERPALELVAQKLTEELVEVECELAQQKGSASQAECRQEDSSKQAWEQQQQETATSVPQPPTDARRQSAATGSEEDVNTFLSNLPKVRIEDGVQKYVLIKVDPERGGKESLKTTLYLVRGNPQAEYHYQCALDTIKELESWGIEAEVQGGGRIECRMSDRQIEIYGHSYQYGRADHSITAQLMKQFFGNDYQVSWGDYGY